MESSFSSFAETNLGVTVERGLNMTKRWVLEAKKANSIQVCIKSNFISRTRKVTVPLYSTLVRLHVECYIMCWAPQHKKDMDIPKQFQ